jgi:GAF domain-containing protein
MNSDTRLADTLVLLADTLVDHFDVIDFMQLLVDRTVELLPVSAAGLMLADDDHDLGLIAWTSEPARRLELFELSADEGPCRDCFHVGEQITNVGLGEARALWPRFGTELRASGFQIVHALPMRLRGQVIGSLNLFQDGPRRLKGHEIQIGQALTDVATIGLMQARVVREHERLAEQLQAALTSRVALEQAKGSLAERSGVDVDTAFGMMRSYARNNGMLLSEVAQRILRGELEIPFEQSSPEN